MSGQALGAVGKKDGGLADSLQGEFSFFHGDIMRILYKEELITICDSFMRMVSSGKNCW